MLVMSVEQVCQLLGCKRRQVFNLLAQGILERAPRYGRELRIYTSSVEAALTPSKRVRKKRSTLVPEKIDPNNIPL